MRCAATCACRSSMAVLLIGFASPGRSQSILPQRQLHFALSGGEEYDSNVLRLSDQDPTTRRSDQHRTGTMSLNWQRPIGQQDFYFIGGISQNRYTNHAQLNNTGINLQSGADWRAGIGCVARTGAVFTRQLVNLADLTRAALASSTQTAQALILSVNCARGALLRPSFDYRDEMVTNSAKELTPNDTTTQSYNTSLGVQRPRLGEIALYANLRRTRYPHHILNSPEYIRFTDAGLRWTRAWGAHLTGTATLSYSNVEPESHATKPYSGLGWTANLTIAPRGTRTHVTIAISRATQQSTLINISYSVDASTQIGIDFALTSRVKLVSSLTLAKRSFVGTAGNTTSALGLGDRSLGVSGGLRYALPFKMLAAPVALACDTSISRRNADNPAFNYRDALVSFSLRVGV